MKISPRLLLGIRICVALVWLYEGLWLKLVTRAPHELAVIEAVGKIGPLSPLRALQLIGAGETLLAAGVLSGLWWRPLAWFQLLLLAAMNGIGIVRGGAAIETPLGLVVRNLPFVMCILIVGLYGPGAWALGSHGRGTSARGN